VIVNQTERKQSARLCDFAPHSSRERLPGDPPVLKINQGALIGLENFLLYLILQPLYQASTLTRSDRIWFVLSMKLSRFYLGKQTRRRPLRLRGSRGFAAFCEISGFTKPSKANESASPGDPFFRDRRIEGDKRLDISAHGDDLGWLGQAVRLL